MKKAANLIIVLLIMFLFLTGCEEQLDGMGRFEIHLITQAIADELEGNPDALVDGGWELYSLLKISDLEQEFYIGNQQGVISVPNVPPGSYTVHPVFMGTDLDVNIEAVANEITRRTIVIPDMRLEYYAVNPESVTDARFRRELASALDRDAVMADITDETLTYTSLYTLLPSAMLNDGLALNSSVVESGSVLSGTAGKDLTISYNENSTHGEVAASIKSQWEECGDIGTITTSGMSWDSLSTLRDNIDFEIIRSGWLMDSNNPIAFLKYLIEMVGFTSSEYNAIIAELEGAHADALLNLDYLSAADYIGYTNQLHDLILDEGLVIPIYER